MARSEEAVRAELESFQKSLQGTVPSEVASKIAGLLAPGELITFAWKTTSMPIRAVVLTQKRVVAFTSGEGVAAAQIDSLEWANAAEVGWGSVTYHPELTAIEVKGRLGHSLRLVIDRMTTTPKQRQELMDRIRNHVGHAHMRLDEEGSLLSQLERLAALRESGALTEEEFELAKQKVLQPG